MTKDILASRIQELSTAINESGETFQRLKTQLEIVTNNHNSLVGRYEEAKAMYQQLEKNEAEKSVEPYVGE